VPVFARARGSLLLDEHGHEYVDFSAGVLPYGHHPPELRSALLAYLSDDGLIHAPVATSVAERTFRGRFDEVVLQPRGMPHHMVFPGPTSAHALEAALQLARQSTGRAAVIGFTDGAHGPLWLTSDRKTRMAARLPLGEVQVVPFDGFLGPEVDTIELIEQMLEDPSSGLEPPAAFLLETVQARGGVNVASAGWCSGSRDRQTRCCRSSRRCSSSARSSTRACRSSPTA
jgi:diaminobutyrate-2-oxoglutarate transaminase